MKKGNLLIVDDEILLLKRIKQNLEADADQVFTAVNGQEAYKILMNEAIHCVICDINMPLMNGVELIRKIRSEKMELPFIFYTAHGSHDLMLEASHYGAFDFLKKPNFEGLEDVAVRGLKAGLAHSEGQVFEESEESYLSEYRKLLKSQKD